MPAQVILDGHSSRSNRELWEECAAKNIDVIIAPKIKRKILKKRGT
jgi:hypothetical protein